MNFSQRFGLFILILISMAYVYFSFFNKEISLPKFKTEEQESNIYNPLEHSLNKEENKKVEAKKAVQKTVKIFVVDNSGNLRGVNRTCDSANEKSCYLHMQ